MLFLLLSIAVLAQNDYPVSGEDYESSWEEDYRGDDYIAYSYYIENLGSEPIVFYNFKIKPNDYRYEVLKSYPEDILILESHQKKSYIQVKVYDQGPGLTWNSKFMRIKDETSTFPEQNRDYVYYWILESETDGGNVYSYHLKNISAKTIKFYDVTLKNNGGKYYLVDNILLKPAFTEPGGSVQLVKYNLTSGDAPSVNWYADWTSFKASSDDFCSGLVKLLEASKDGFSSIKGEKKNASDPDALFEIYYCKEHIPGATEEAIEDMIFYFQYSGILGSQGPQNLISDRFYSYKSKIETCLPDFPERQKEDEDDSATSVLEVEYEAEVDYIMHYLKLRVQKDYLTDNYYLELIVEESY